MNNIVSTTAGASFPPALPFMHGTQQSLLFPTLLKRIDPRRRMKVLEIGSALPETARFFSQFKCRVYFAAMYSDPILELQSGELTQAEITRHLRQSFAFPRGIRFDLCLFWDFLNYLDAKALRSFNTVIRSHLHAATRVHAFAVRTRETSLPNQQYGIEQTDLFKIRSRDSSQLTYFAHTQNDLAKLLPCLKIDQGMLLPDGRLEILMTTNKN